MKKQKPLTKEKYLKQFSRAVRWRLPPQESEEAIADYRELIFQEEREESRLVEELGTPVQAAHLLTDVKAYHRWLAVFAVLAFGLFLQARWAWTAWHYLFIGLRAWWYPVLVMAVGLPLSLYWFRRHGQKNGPLSWKLVLPLASILVFALVWLAFMWYVMDTQTLATLTTPENFTIYYEPWQLVSLRTLIMYSGVVCAAIALAGLVLAKCRDRRWLALYTLCLTVGAMLGFAIFILHAMDFTSGVSKATQAYIFIRILPVGAVGLIGTGVALC